MTIAELIAQLQRFDSSREVVLDVNIRHCDSDRNILTITEAEDYHPHTGLIFIEAGESWSTSRRQTNNS